MVPPKVAPQLMRSILRFRDKQMVGLQGAANIKARGSMLHSARFIHQLNSMKIAYLTNCFGTQSHTFMRREIRALRALGVDLALYGIREDTSAQATDARDLVAETTYLYPVQKSTTIAANFHYFLRHPLKFASGFWEAFTSQEFSLARRAKMVAHYFLAAPIARHMEAAGITHVHAQFLNVSTSIAMYTSMHAGIPFSVTVHSAGSYKAEDTVGLHQKLSSAQFLIMISHYNVNYYDAVAHCREKSYVVRCGMDLEDFSFQIPNNLLQRHSDGTKPKVRLLGVGRFVAKKGFRYLIETAAILKQREINFELRIIGNGPLDSELRAQVDQLRLQDYVVFLGQKSVAEVRVAMADADMVIVPSITTDNGDMEGLPVVIMEAMATGAAVIASDHAGIPEIVIPEDTGFLTPERDPESIANAVCHFIDNPSADMLIRARRLIEEHFNIAVVAQQRQEIFCRHHQAN
jgi:colanic acid/amylovoran biosynthesis glycosyltransferase